MEDEICRVKVVVVGDISVGKTSIALRFTKGTFVENYSPTVGAGFLSKTLEVNERPLVFQVWDTAGQERFRGLVPMYLRDAKAALLVYDITDQASFEGLEKWMMELLRHAPPGIATALVANKCDLEESVEESVAGETAQLFADKYNMLFTEASAKTGQNVEQVFHSLGTKVLDIMEKEAKPLERSIKLDSSYKADNSKQSCCR